jgi:ABC-type glycerol-3-phosphate transport system permease component
MKKVGKSIIYILLAVVAFVWVYPFIWMITASLKTQDEFLQAD